MHEASKRYKPVHRRADFFDLYSDARVAAILPAGYGALRSKLSELMTALGALDQTPENYGMVHFDYSDGNYSVDYTNGDITAYDFDNACTCFYLYDLANLWSHGVGWIQREKSADKRRAFMDDYFAHVLRGYREKTSISDDTLSRLPLMLQAVLMEGILDEFAVQKQEGEEPQCDEEQAWRIMCMLEDIPYMGFFSPLYNRDAPFMLREKRP